MIADTQQSNTEHEPGYIGRIPLRNIWLLMLYASDLFRHGDRAKIALEENPDDIAELVAEYLAYTVERRLRRNLSFGYIPREAILTRVRGKIDLLTTERGMLLDRGKIACRFEELTVNTIRNRLVHAALLAISSCVRENLALRCRSLANTLKKLGVSGSRPGRAEISADRIGRHDIDDLYMVEAAKLALELALPTEFTGPKSLVAPGREETWIRHLFEKAVAGFFNVVLPAHEWNVSAGTKLYWQKEFPTPGIDLIFPSMKTDIILHNKAEGRRIVIDTKFTEIIKKGWRKESTLSSGYIYQMYAYLRSQEGNGDLLNDMATGVLLHPAVDGDIDEAVKIQGHVIRFATVDLAASTYEIRNQLLRIIEPPSLGL